MRAWLFQICLKGIVTEEWGTDKGTVQPLIDIPGGQNGWAWPARSHCRKGARYLGHHLLLSMQITRESKASEPQASTLRWNAIDVTAVPRHSLKAWNVKAGILQSDLGEYALKYGKNNFSEAGVSLKIIEVLWLPEHLSIIIIHKRR